MKFSVEKSILQTAAATALRAVSPRSTLPVLEGILLSAEQDTLVLTGYNMETGIRVTMPADVKREGKAVLNGRMFFDIIRKMPDDAVTISVFEKSLVTISCGLSEFELVGLDPSAFPELPGVEQEQGLSLPEAVLKSMLGQTLFAVSENDAKTVHKGALFMMENNSLTIVTVDGYRLALRREAVVQTGDELRCVVHGGALRELEHLLNDVEDQNVIMRVGSRHAQFVTENMTLVCRLLEGEFLDYQKAIPQENAVVFSVNGKKLYESVERVSLLVSDKIKNPVRLTVSQNEISLLCVTPLGRAADRCTIERAADRPAGDDLEIGFNNRYLLDALRASFQDEMIQISMNTALSPCILKPVEGDKYLFMVLPVRLKNE